MKNIINGQPLLRPVLFRRLFQEFNICIYSVNSISLPISPLGKLRRPEVNKLA